MFHRGEVPCIIDLDRDGNPFVSEVLPLDGNKLTLDKLKILYLEKSTEILKQEEVLFLDQFIQEMQISEACR